MSVSTSAWITLLVQCPPKIRMRHTYSCSYFKVLIFNIWFLKNIKGSAFCGNDSILYSSEQECVDIPKWQKWYEDLISDNFSARSYGYLSCIVKTKLYFDSFKQTYYELKKNDKRVNENEVFDSYIKLLEFDEKSIEQLQFLNQDLTGIVIKTWKHMIHYDWLISYKEQNMKNRMRTMLIEDFDINKYPCPLWKSYWNSLIPPQEELIKLINGESIEVCNEKNNNLLEDLMIDVVNMIKITSWASSELSKSKTINIDIEMN